MHPRPSLGAMRSPDDRFAGLLNSTANGWQPEDDLEDLVPGNRPVPRRTVLIVLAGIAVVVIASLVVFTALQHQQAPAPVAQPVTSAPVLTPGAGSQPSTPTDVVVHVAGHVASPGLVTLAPGARVADAIDAAGGFTQDANLSALNLARLVNDGEQIMVPKKGEEVPAGGTSGSAGHAGAAGGGKINLNTADATALETLPGVGPATSAAILKHREDNGPFTSVEQLDDVPGIGPATLKRLAPLVTV